MEQFQTYFMGAMQKYVDFNGRDTRKQFWMFVLYWFIIYLALLIVDGILTGGLLTSLFSLGTIIPWFAIGARRLHDTGRTGWWQLLYLIPLIGFIVMIIFLVQDSQGDNEYGPGPDTQAPTPV